jgi:hypothetical protein
MSNNSITKELAMGSIFSGQISEVHLNNMKLYPFIFIDDVSQVEISYDIITDPANAEPGKKSTVSYTVSFKSGNTPENIKDCSQNLQKALSILFSQQITVILRDQKGQELLDLK